MIPSFRGLQGRMAMGSRQITSRMMTTRVIFRQPHRKLAVAPSYVSYRSYFSNLTVPQRSLSTSPEISTETSRTATETNANPYHHSADLARMMIPSDANIAGNVHGGTIMKMMEEAAGVAAHRYFNFQPQSNLKEPVLRVCALSTRVERMTFQHPVHVGDVAKVHARVVFASTQTVAVSVQVTAERMAWSSSNSSSMDNGGADTICNRALIWLVGVVLPPDADNRTSFNPEQYARALAPPFPIPDEDDEGYKAYEWAANSYETYQMRKRKQQTGENTSDNSSSLDMGTQENGVDPSCNTLSPSSDCFTPDYSAVELAQWILPSDCTFNTGLVGGGVVMKLMDNACGVAAVRHCGTNVVTVAVDSVNLQASVMLGDVLKVRARPSFTSSKTLELEVSVVVERFLRHNDDDDGSRLERREIVTTQQAYFTFVSLPPQGEASLPMRPLVVKTPEDIARFYAGKRRYERLKARRQEQKLQGEPKGQSSWSELDYL